MSRLLPLILLLLIAFSAKAQDYRVVSVEYQPNDMTAREEMMSDENGRQCAVLRISTKNLTTAEREGFYFECDYASWVVERRIVGGELWLWVSPGLKVLKIFHNDLGNIEMHISKFGVGKIESLMVYKVVIQGTIVAGSSDVIPEITQQYLAFQVSPPNAVLEVNDELWNVESDGSSMKFVNFGTYTYRVKAPNYHSEVGEVTVNDPENTQKVIVKLKPNFIEVTLTVDADAEIWVNNEKKGVRTWTGSLGKGNYKIECKQAGCETTVVTKEITAESNGKTFTLVAPRPIFGSLNVESTPSFATVFIDGKEMGETPKFIKEIQVGKHQLKLTKDGYEKHEESVEIKKNERKQLKLVLQENSKKTVTLPTSPQQSQAAVKPVKSVFFVMANVAYSVAPQTSFGFTVGSAKKIGWYASLGSNLDFNYLFYHGYPCDADGQIESETIGEYQFTGNQKTTYFSATAGLVFWVSDPLYVYCGGGYGVRKLFWEFDETDGGWEGYAYNKAYSYLGPAIDAGFMLHFRGVGISAGVRTIGVDYLEAKLGIGYTLKKR